jgi:hypothetical protein
VKPGTPGGTFGWSQHAVGPDGWSLLVQDDAAASATSSVSIENEIAWWAATLRGRVGARIRDLLGISKVGCTLQHSVGHREARVTDEIGESFSALAFNSARADLRCSWI